MGDFLFTFDLKSSYHHLKIYKEHRQYLGFSWKESSNILFFVCNQLPFGISTAGYIFQRSHIAGEAFKIRRNE